MTILACTSVGRGAWDRRRTFKAQLCISGTRSPASIRSKTQCRYALLSRLRDMTDHAWHRNLSPAVVETVAGFTAGVVSTLALHPLDIIKTRLQGMLQPHFVRATTLSGSPFAMARRCLHTMSLLSVCRTVVFSTATSILDFLYLMLIPNGLFQSTNNHPHALEARFASLEISHAMKGSSQPSIAA